MNSKIKMLRELIRTEIRKAINEDGIQMPQDPKIKAATQKQVKAKEDELKADEESIKAKFIFYGLSASWANRIFSEELMLFCNL